jgi:uncharacterized protein
VEQRISIATLAAQDLDALTGFYERLGWRAGFRNEEVTFFQLNGVVLGLWHRDHFAAAVGVPPETLRPGGMALGHNVRTREEVDHVLAAAERAGARIVQAPHDAEWGGRSGHFRRSRGPSVGGRMEPRVANRPGRRRAAGVDLRDATIILK